MYNLINKVLSFQFVRFGLVGFLGMLIDTLLLITIKELFSLDTRICVIISFVGAVTSNYFINKVWTFQLNQNRQPILGYFKYVLINIGGLIVRIFIIHLFIVIANIDQNYGYIISNIVGITFGMFFNFFFAKTLVFN